MLVLAIAGIVYLFLLVGAIIFVFSAIIPQLRRYALSAALWCATWGPSCVGFLLLAGTAAITAAFVTKDRDLQKLHAPRLVAALGWTYLTGAIVMTIAIASFAAWLHQTLMHRLTFALFRIYATLVCAGIASVFGLALGWLLAEQEVHYLLIVWIMCMVTLISSFATLAYKNAHTLRGDRPDNFNWISAEEFNGT